LLLTMGTTPLIEEEVGSATGLIFGEEGN
jgi:hypothetical protein